MDASSSHQIKWLQLADTKWPGSTAVSLYNKYLLAVGGPGVHDTVLVLKREKSSTITSASWKSIGSLPKVHSLLSAVSFANQIITIGGVDEKHCHSKVVSVGKLQ